MLNRTRHLGRIALVGAIAVWLAFIVTLFVGGIDPSTSLAAVLKVVMSVSVLLSLATLCLGGFAAVRGPQRIAGGLGALLSLLYLLIFSGAFLALIPR